MKVVDIDKYLVEEGITFTFKGRKYEVTDVNDEVIKGVTELRNMNPEELSAEAYISVVAKLFNCQMAELSGLGLKAALKVIEEVTENLLPASLEEPPSEDSKKQEPSQES